MTRQRKPRFPKRTPPKVDEAQVWRDFHLRMRGLVRIDPLNQDNRNPPVMPWPPGVKEALVKERNAPGAEA